MLGQLHVNKKERRTDTFSDTQWERILDSLNDALTVPIYVLNTISNKWPKNKDRKKIESANSI